MIVTIIKTQPGRGKLLVFAALGFSLFSLAALIFTLQRGVSIFLAESLAISFVFGLIIAFTLNKKTGGAPILTLTREGISIPVGFRLIMLNWDNIETIAIKEIRGNNFLAVKMKHLEQLPRIGQRIGALNEKDSRLHEEDSGYHFLYRGHIFEMPLEEVIQILSSYHSDTLLRQSLPQAQEETQPAEKEIRKK
ncbi:MAG: STM3941 family protein [Candidatus Xenobiia bacterium LiM19]